MRQLLDVFLCILREIRWLHRDANVTDPLHDLHAGCSTRMPRHLILVPTEMERRRLEPVLAPAMAQGCTVALCGFGPVAAAARTAQLLAEHAPERVLLVGIAGRLDERLAVGSAYRFERVACFGIGAGSGSEFVPAGAMGCEPSDWASRHVPTTRSPSTVC
jgi:hypothetical protein